MMEVKVGMAHCGMVQQMALWQHPPVVGSAVCEYQLQVPAEMDSLRMRFAVGIRDGALMEGDNLCAFRIYVNGRRVWSTTKQSNDWERYIIESAQPVRPRGGGSVRHRRAGRQPLELGGVGRASVAGLHVATRTHRAPSSLARGCAVRGLGAPTSAARRSRVPAAGALAPGPRSLKRFVNAIRT